MVIILILSKCSGLGILFKLRVLAQVAAKMSHQQL